MENEKNPPVITGSQDGRTVSVVGDTYRILINGKETGGAFATIDMLIPPGGGADTAVRTEAKTTSDASSSLKASARVLAASIKGAMPRYPTGVMHEHLADLYDRLEWTLKT